MKYYIFRLSIVVFGMAMIFGCSRGPYGAANKSYKKQTKELARLIRSNPTLMDTGLPVAANWVGTTNFNLRKPNYVILHHTAMNTCELTLTAFTKPASQVSAHYVICKDGTIHHMLNDYLRAWHGGVSKWGNVTDINSVSIGIELDNNGFEEFAEPQLNSLLKLLAVLKKRHNIPAANFVGHGDIAPSRKSDPNWRFPWKRLADMGYGYWYDDTSNISIPPDFNRLHALRIIGFDIKDSAAAVAGFKRHWLADTSRGLNAEQTKVLYQLMRKFL